MQNNKESHRSRRQGASEPQDTSARSDQSGRLSRWMQSLLQMGLGEPLLRAATHIFSVIAIVIVIWLAQVYFSQPNARTKGNQRPPQGPTPPPAAPLTDASAPQDLSSFGIVRQTDPHTNIPARPRQDVVKYTVVAGDTVSGIAERYGLQPATIFAANYYILLDDPHSLRPGQDAHLVVADHALVPEERFGEADRVGPPEHFAVDDEARHAEHPARDRVLGVLAQRILDRRGRKALLVDVERAHQRREALRVG